MCIMLLQIPTKGTKGLLYLHDDQIKHLIQIST